MIIQSIITITALAVLLIGTYCDIRWREVPDWLNFSILFAGIGFRIIFTIVENDWNYLLYGLYGFIAMFIIALVMFYAGQWGGGDSKMVIGLGALIGLPLSLDAFLIGFLINTIIFGALFSLIFSAYLCTKHWKKFKEEFVRMMEQKRRYRHYVWAATITLLIITIFSPTQAKIILAVSAGLLFSSLYIFIYLKAVEKSAMLKYVKPEELTEGDWIAEPVYVGKKYIAGPKDLGIEMSQIKKLINYKKKKKIDKILIKVGIPFVPSFLLAYIATYLWGDFVLQFLGLI